MLGSTLSRDSRPYPHDRYALALEAHLSLGTGFPHFRGHLHGEGGKRPALTGIPKRNLPRLTSSFHGQKIDQQPRSIPPIAGDRRPFAVVCFEATAKYELRLARGGGVTLRRSGLGWMAALTGPGRVMLQTAPPASRGRPPGTRGAPA